MSGKESSIAVTVRVRPFTSNEQMNLQHISNEPVFLGDGSLTNDSNGFAQKYPGKTIRKIINVVDDKMLIFDPPENNPMVKMQQALFSNGGHSRQTSASRIREHRFVFDRLFDEDAGQNDVYCHTTRPLLDNVLDGYNATVFAYGATGCGKTHTISGTPDEPGIIFLTMKELFEKIEALRDTKIVELSLSYLEIYNETIRDLLDPGGSKKPLQLRENADKRISVSNLSSHKPENVNEVMDMILQGNQNRTMSPTEANAVSSRSHAVLQINITQKARTANLSEAHTFATLSIIDLAGSERASATKNRGERLMEGANINKSLLALGNCINALCDPRQRGHVPYRDSKLTRLLKFSLGGNCKTVMIVCVSPSSHHYDETLNTLKYADRAKRIKTKVSRNQHSLDRHVGSYLKMITEQKAEIEELRAREGKFVEEALEKSKKSREYCIKALNDAVNSFDLTIEKTIQDRKTKSKLLSRLRKVSSQIYQIDIISNCLRLQSEKVNISKASLICNTLNDTKNNCLLEKQQIEQHIQSINYNQTIDSAINMLNRRLQEISGWSKDLTISFETYINWKRTQLENELLQEVIDTTISYDSLSLMSNLLFKYLGRLEEMKEMPEDIIKGEVILLIEELFNDMHINSKVVNENNISYQPSPLPMSSSNNPSQIQPPSRLQPTYQTNLSSPLPTNSPKRLRRVSILKKKPTALSKRMSTKPSPIKRKSKRVRWEDSDNSETIDSSIDASADKTSSILSPLREVTIDENSSIDASITTTPSMKKRDLTRRSLSKSRPSILGINKNMPGRVEKENSISPIGLDQSIILEDSPPLPPIPTTNYGRVPYHLASTASSAMKKKI